MDNSNRIPNPKTIDECNLRIDAHKADITSIQDQLRKRKRPSKSAGKEDLRRFFIWRRKAVDALSWKQMELSVLKTWKREFFRERGKKLCESLSPEGLLFKSYRITKRLLSLGEVELYEEEQDTLDTIQDYLRSVDLGGESNQHGRAGSEEKEENKAGTVDDVVLGEGPVASPTNLV